MSESDAEQQAVTQPDEWDSYSDRLVNIAILGTLGTLLFLGGMAHGMEAMTVTEVGDAVAIDVERGFLAGPAIGALGVVIASQCIWQLHEARKIKNETNLNGSVARRNEV